MWCVLQLFLIKFKVKYCVRKCPGYASNNLYNLRVKSGKISLSADPSLVSLSFPRL